MKKIALSLISAALLTSSAFAIDYSSYADKASEAQDVASSMPAPSKDFKGFYAGVVAGYGFVKIPTEEKDLSVKGLNGGLNLGYMAPLGTSGVFLGLDLTLTLNGDKGTQLREQVDAAGVRDNWNTVFRNRNTMEFTARAGYAFKKFMPFVKVGVGSSSTVAKTTHVQVTPGAPPVMVTDFSKRSMRHTGLLLGTGVAFKVSSHILATLDYGCTFYPKKQSRGIDMKKWTNNVVRVGVAYKF